MKVLSQFFRNDDSFILNLLREYPRSYHMKNGTVRVTGNVGRGGGHDAYLQVFWRYLSPMQHCPLLTPTVKSLAWSRKQQLQACEPLSNLCEYATRSVLEYSVYSCCDKERIVCLLAGDIPAIWLRDSVQQAMSLLNIDDPSLLDFHEKHVATLAALVMLDPYANAFYVTPTTSPWKDDVTSSPLPELIHERKWELDSLCAFLHYVALASEHLPEIWTTALPQLHDEAPSSNVLHAVRAAVAVMREQQRKETPGPYSFRRVTCWGPDAVYEMGLGAPWRPCGAVFSTFRPSDDATLFGFNVASNLYAVEALTSVADRIKNDFDSTLVDDMTNLANEILQAVFLHGVADHSTYGSIFCYEFDGFGNRVFMDDANIPGLLSIPLLCGSLLNREPRLRDVYARTRKFVLSDSNPYFIRSNDDQFSGLGSPHTLRISGRIWPLSLILRALTTDDEVEIDRCIIMLLRSAFPDERKRMRLRESFCANDVRAGTRLWFPMADAMLARLIASIESKGTGRLAALAERIASSLHKEPD